MSKSNCNPNISHPGLDPLSLGDPGFIYSERQELNSCRQKEIKNKEQDKSNAQVDYDITNY